MILRQLRPVSPRLAVWWSAGIIAACGLAAYHNSYTEPFVLDDALAITHNPSIRHLLALGKVLDPPAEAATAQGRPVLNLTLAINYAVGGTNPVGYHAVNLAIHVLAALTLFGLTRRTLLLPCLQARFGGAALPLALATAALWMLHPLQTEAVTYTIQRAESLMGLFYFFTLYAFLRSVQSPASRWWQAAAIGSCFLGMGTKEVMASAPVMVLIYDRTFLSGSWRESWRRHRGVLAGLAATWALLACLIIAGGGNRGGTVGFGIRNPWWAYALTQGEAIVRYLRLSVWPHPLVFEYGTFWVRDILPAAPRLALVLLLAAGAAAALWRAPAVGFLGTWFFAILAPTSLVPGTTQMIVEHRMYLALAAEIALLVVGAYAWFGQRSLWIWPAAALALGWLTERRNWDYRSKESLWADTVRHRPLNAIAHFGLADAYAAEPGRLDAALGEFRASLRLNPDRGETHDGLGLLLERLPGHGAEAIAEFREAIRINPRDAMAHNNLGNALADRPGGLAEGIEELKQAERIGPWYAEIHFNLGRALARVPGHLPEAVAELQEALRLQPEESTYVSLGTLLAQMPGRKPGAIAAFRTALRLDPSDPEAHYNLGRALATEPGGLTEAAGEYREAIRLDPSDSKAHNNLGSAYSRLPGRDQEALAEFQTAVRLDPSDPSAHCNLGSALAGLPGRLPEALAELRAAIRLDPNLLEAHFNLGMILAGGAGTPTEAAEQFAAVLRINPDFAPAREALAQLQTGGAEAPPP